MKRRLAPALMSLALLASIETTSHAAGSQLSPRRLDLLDRLGYFTPAFKQVVHNLVNAKQAVVDAKVEQKKLDDELPDLEKQASDAAAKVADLQKQFTALDHTDDSDFVELQKKMAQADGSGDLEKQLADAAQMSPSDFDDLKKKVDDANVILEAQRVLAQAYVWAYPASSNQADAQRDLQNVQTKIADLAQALTNAGAARVAAHDKLVQRALAKDLSITEWRDFLFNVSKEDILKLLGRPQSATQDDWTYSDGWTEDAITHQRVGLNLTFNAGRVMNVSEITP